MEAAGSVQETRLGKLSVSPSAFSPLSHGCSWQAGPRASEGSSSRESQGPTQASAVRYLGGPKRALHIKPGLGKCPICSWQMG